MRHESEPDPGLGLLHAQSRVLEALANGGVLHGTGDVLIAQLGVSTGAFRLALLDLVAGGWIYTETTRDGVLTVGRERRRPGAEPYSGVERRRPDERRTTSRWEHHEAALSVEDLEV